MDNKTNSLPVELRLWLTNYQDGLFDMFFGSTLIIAGLNQLFTYLEIERPIYLQLGIVIFVVIFLLVKKYVSQPRTGQVRFSIKRKEKRIKALIIALVAQVITAVLFYASVKHLLPEGQYSGQLSLIIEFLFLLVVFSAIAWYTDYKWFYFIGIVMALSWPVNYLLQPYLHSTLPGIILQLGSGTLLFVIGLSKFVIFLRKYPKHGDLNYEKQ
jgi:hypothetical protein